MSLFINHISRDYANHDFMRMFIENLCLFGKVKRIDFAVKQGTPYYMAFVHMERWYDNWNVFSLFEMIRDNKVFDTYGVVFGKEESAWSLYQILNAYKQKRAGGGGGSGFSLADPSLLKVDDVSGRARGGTQRFIRFQENKKPIPDTLLNNHQLAANLAFAESQISGLVETVQRLQSELDNYKNRLDVIESRV
jgi:hypothetical protein